MDNVWNAKNLTNEVPSIWCSRWSPWIPTLLLTPNLSKTQILYVHREGGDKVDYQSVDVHSKSAKTRIPYSLFRMSTWKGGGQGKGG